MNAYITSYSLQPVNVVEILFTSLCIFGAVLLHHRARFRALCILLLLEAVLMTFNFSEETGLFNQSTLVTPIFTLSTGPAFYFFVRHLVYSDAYWKRRDMLHFLPMMLAIPFTSHTQSVIAIGSLSLITYGTVSYQLLTKYRRASNASSSAAFDMRLSWLTSIIWIFFVLGATDTVRLNLQTELSYSVLNTWYLAHQSAVLILYASLIGFAVKQPLLFNGVSEFDDPKSSFKAKPSPGDASLSKTLFSQIDQHLVDSELFKQPRLSLNDVAGFMKIGVKDVSNAINIGSGKNFCEYINGLRVTEVQRRIDQGVEKHLTLLDIAVESGFNSKSSFNSAFRQFTGLTPSQYQRQVAASKP